MKLTRSGMSVDTERGREWRGKEEGGTPLESNTWVRIHVRRTCNLWLSCGADGDSSDNGKACSCLPFPTPLANLPTQLFTPPFVHYPLPMPDCNPNERCKLVVAVAIKLEEFVKLVVEQLIKI